MDALLTTSQVARITGRDRRTIRRWVTDDIVPGLGVEIGRQVFIRRSALEKLLGRRAQSGFTIRATEVPPEQKAETLEKESRPALEEEALGSHEPQRFEDFRKALDNDTDDDLPF